MKIIKKEGDFAININGDNFVISAEFELYEEAKLVMTKTISVCVYKYEADNIRERIKEKFQDEIQKWKNNEIEKSNIKTMIREII